MKKKIPIWKAAPFIRILTPFIIAILLEFSFNFSLLFIAINSCLLLLALGMLKWFPMFLQYRLAPLQGIVLHGIILTVGMFVYYQNDIRYQSDWFGHRYQGSDALVVRVETSLMPKVKFYKTMGSVLAIVHGNVRTPAIGNVMLYLPIDSNVVSVGPGDLLVITHALEPILNSGNPGAFDYKRYAGFKQIYHQAYVRSGEWALVAHHAGPRFIEWINDSKTWLLNQLKKYIPGNKSEWGIAEALLIGYMDDLDKDIVQAYSNTGVVHIIAISGMHLGLIYMALVWICLKIPGIKKSLFLQTVLILCGLWSFSLLTGASASVLRSAVMFSCMSIGKLLSRNSSIYNSLAASAFMLLCYNPCFLWDLGFELSYLAVIGIVLFQKSILSWVNTSSYWITKIWEMIAISLAAQVFTFPVCLFYFHQFPLLFLITNLIAVPLSTLILFTEIALLTLSFFPLMAKLLGQLINILILWMNEFILKINHISFARLDHIDMSLPDTILLYLIIISISAWMFNRKKNGLFTSLLFILSLTLLKGDERLNTIKQRKLVIYQIPHHTAIELIEGTQAITICDSAIFSDKILDMNYLYPSDIYFHISKQSKQLLSYQSPYQYFYFNRLRILLLNGDCSFKLIEPKLKIDMVIISGNPAIELKNLFSAFDCRVCIFDASNNLWKIAKWKKECESLHLRYYSIPEKGALVVDANLNEILP